MSPDDRLWANYYFTLPGTFDFWTDTVTFSIDEFNDGATFKLVAVDSLGFVPDDIDLDPIYHGTLTCCGEETGGWTGDMDCDGGGLHLTDITRLVSRVYITPDMELCCEANADTNCDGKINLGDITRMINAAYINPIDQHPCHCSEQPR